jgi:hypothetical protein
MMAMEIKTIRQNGIRFLNADYYDDNLYGLRDSVLIKYSLFDLSYVKVCSSSGDFLCNAKRVMPVHPMAHHIGDVKDVEELKQKLAQQKRLERQTINLAKQFTAHSSRFTEKLDWQKVAEIAPRVVEKIAGMTESGVLREERRIPEAEVVSNELKISDEIAPAGIEHSPRIFSEMFQRYEYLLQHKNLTAEDQQWITEYAKSKEYQIIYGQNLVEAVG